MRDSHMYRKIIANAEQLEALQLNNREWTETRYSRTIEHAAFYDQEPVLDELVDEQSFIRGYN